MALCKIKQKKFEEAVRDAGEAVAADPKYLKGFYRRATANLRLGKKVEACLDFKRILEIEEDNAQVKRELEKVRAKLTTSERQVVDDFNEGFKRVEIEEEEDSDTDTEDDETPAKADEQSGGKEPERRQSEHTGETETSEQKPLEAEPKASVLEADKAIEEFVTKLKKKKERMTSEIKSGLFEGCMAELAENISEAEEQRAEHFGLDQYHVGYTLLNRKKLQKTKVDQSMLDAWIEGAKVELPAAAQSPNLVALLELELSLKSNLCYCYKQIGQAKFLCFLASNILQLCGGLMKGQNDLSQKASLTFQKTLKRRALGLEQNENLRGSFRDFWVARTFDSLDSVIVNGLNRTKSGLDTNANEESKSIERDFEEFLRFFRSKEPETKQNPEPEPTTEEPSKGEKDQLCSSVFERVPHEDDQSQKSDQKVKTVSMTTSPEKKLQETEATPTAPPQSRPETTEFESSVLEVSLSTAQLEQLQETKLAGNACFKTRDFQEAVRKFSEVIQKVFKGPTSDFLLGSMPSDPNRRLPKRVRTPNEPADRAHDGQLEAAGEESATGTEGGGGAGAERAGEPGHRVPENGEPREGLRGLELGRASVQRAPAENGRIQDVSSQIPLPTHAEPGGHIERRRIPDPGLPK